MTKTAKRSVSMRARHLQPSSWLLVLALASGLLPMQRAVAQVAQYTLDPVHTRVMFSLSHAGYSNAIGTVSGSTGVLHFDEDDWSSATLQASIPISRIDLGDMKWNQAALATNLLDATKYPVASFVSTRIEPIDARHASVHGMLTLHGISKEVELAVTLNQVKRYPLPPFRRTAGFSASTRISRAEFGITAWPSVIGDTVELRIEAEARLDSGRHEQDDGRTGSQPARPHAKPVQPEPISPPTQEHDKDEESAP